MFLLPSAVLFTVVIVVPFLMNIGISFTRWQGIGDPRWLGIDNYTRLFADERFWASFRNNLALIVAMAIVPTIVGLVLAATLFDDVGKKFGPVRPAPCGPPTTCRRCCRSRWPASSGGGSCIPGSARSTPSSGCSARNRAAGSATPPGRCRA
nr:hypothetical protein GCM10020093_091090 [Planobispora longispora]